MHSFSGKNLPDTSTCKDLIRIATLCNRAKFKEDQMEKPIYARECTGDASETALMKFTEILTGDVLAVRNKNKAVAEIPFNSTTKFQVECYFIYPIVYFAIVAYCKIKLEDPRNVPSPRNNR